MKRLITYNDNSYMPLWQTDLKFVQDNMIQVLTQLAKTFAFEREMFIVSGCELTDEGSDYSVTEGLVMINGELLYVPAQTISSSFVFAPYISKFEYLNPGGEKQFIKDLATEFRNTWDDNYGKLHAQPDPEPLPNRLYLANAKTITDMIIEKAGEQLLTDTGWINLTLINGWDADQATPQYRVLNGQVFLRGDITDADATDIIFSTIPAAYRPDIDTTLYSPAGDYAVLIKAGGAIQTGNQGTTILNGLNWLIG